MTDLEIIRYIEQYCVKTGDIEVKDIKEDGRYTLIIPVFNGEYGEEQTATLDLEFTYDGEDVALYNFPRRLLTDEDYNLVSEAICEVMQPLYEAYLHAKGFRDIGKKYGFQVLQQGGKYNLYAKNTDNEPTLWLSYDEKKDTITCRGHTDYLNIWLCDTRKDFTPEKCLQFIDDLNENFELVGKNRFTVEELIDPEDWQEIANVRNAYEDPRYTYQKRLRTLEDQVKAAAERSAPSNGTAAQKEMDGPGGR